MQYHVILGCVITAPDFTNTLHWRHNDHDGVSSHQPHGCLLNRLSRRRSKKTSKLLVTGLCVGNSPGPVNSPHKGPVTRKTVSIWWRHHESWFLITRSGTITGLTRMQHLQATPEVNTLWLWCYWLYRNRLVPFVANKRSAPPGCCTGGVEPPPGFAEVVRYWNWTRQWTWSNPRQHIPPEPERMGM